jgi:hypothetical protein
MDVIIPGATALIFLILSIIFLFIPLLNEAKEKEKANLKLSNFECKLLFNGKKNIQLETGELDSISYNNLKKIIYNNGDKDKVKKLLTSKNMFQTLYMCSMIGLHQTILKASDNNNENKFKILFDLASIGSSYIDLENESKEWINSMKKMVEIE